MLVLDRKLEEEIIVEVPPANKETRIVIKVVRGGNIKLGFEAAEYVNIVRSERYTNAESLDRLRKIEKVQIFYLKRERSSFVIDEVQRLQEEYDQKPGKLFTSFEPKPDDILYYFCGPRIFVVNANDNLYLACWSDGDSVSSRYIAVPTTQQIVQNILERDITILDAIISGSKRLLNVHKPTHVEPSCWVCDVVDSTRRLIRCESVALKDVPADWMPIAGITL